jgi:hypothetical protein
MADRIVARQIGDCRLHAVPPILDIAGELDRHLPPALRARPAIAKLETALAPLAAVTDADDGLEVLAELLAWTRRRGGRFGVAGEAEAGDEAGRGNEATARLRLLLGLLERSLPLREAFAEVSASWSRPTLSISSAK